MKIQIILGSTRPNRAGAAIARWVTDAASSREGVDYELIDLAEINLPMFNEPQSPMMGQYEHEHTKAWSKKVSEADGYIFVTPEYNHSFPAALKNALDYLYTEWNHKPAAFVSYGAAVGGSRAVEQLRLVAVELQMIPIRNSVHIINFWNVLDDSGKFKDSSYDKALQGIFQQTETLARTLLALRNQA